VPWLNGGSSTSCSCREHKANRESSRLNSHGTNSRKPHIPHLTSTSHLFEALASLCLALGAESAHRPPQVAEGCTVVQVELRAGHVRNDVREDGVLREVVERAAGQLVEVHEIREVAERPLEPPVRDPLAVDTVAWYISVRLARKITVANCRRSRLSLQWGR
jgi:hypothetical protein